MQYSTRLGFVMASVSAALAFAGTGVAQAETRWKEQPSLETPGWLPGSAAFSHDGKTLALGGAAGETAAYDWTNRREKWRVGMGGGFAAVVFSADGEAILATFKDGVEFLDADTGRPGMILEEKGSEPIAVGVFPDQEIPLEGSAKVLSHKVIFGDARGYHVKTWIKPDAVGGIHLRTIAEDREPADPGAVPLAVDPQGRSVAVTGPVDRETGDNILWAWVAGNYGPDSPGNRRLEGHPPAVVSAAWSQDGGTIITGDASGRVIVWDAETMQEAHRRELVGRVAAVAVSHDGKHLAAIVVGATARYYVWEAAKSEDDISPLAVDAHDFAGPVRACLAFSPDGRQLVGSAINLAWLARTGELTGELHVWEAEPR
jgi:WD40 repeat protein